MSAQEFAYDLPLDAPPPTDAPPPVTEDAGLPDGVYFDLPEDDYHALPRLSASGIKDLQVSIEDFWARSWMNPRRHESDTDTIAKTMGRAYHKRILEGRAAFQAAYAARLDPADHPDALRTVEDIKARLAKHHEKLSGAKPALIERLKAVEPDAVILDDLISDHGRRNAGKTLLAADLIERIELEAAFIERHPHLRKAFTGGRAEVTILWTERDRERGRPVPMKARLDYLKAKATVDLKTFSNPLGKPLERAIYGAMASGRYHIQAAVYDRARAALAHLVPAGRVRGDHDADWLHRCAAVREPVFLFVFQQTGGAPVARGFTLPRSMAWQSGVVAMEQAIDTFARCRHAFGDDPWVDPVPLESFDDNGFPIFMFD